MNKYRVGFNAIAAQGRVGDRQRYLDTCARMRSAFQMEISDYQLGVDLYNACGGQTNVIHRSYGSGENNYWRWGHKDYKDPVAHAHELMAVPDHDIWLHVSNEPNPDRSNPEEVRACLDWHAIVVETICSHGRKCVVGNFAAGGGGGVELGLLFETDVWDNFLSIVAKYSDLCRIGIHEYSPILTPMTWNSIINGYRDRDNVQYEDWLYINHLNPDLRFPDYTKQVLPWTYHGLRIGWLANKLRKMGLYGIVKFVITEYGTDRLQDVDGPNGPYEYFKNTLGVPEPYAAPHGFYANYKVYSYYWPGISTSEAIFRQVRWGYMNYPEDLVDAVLLFDWGYDDEFEPRGFNAGADTALHEMMINDSITVHNEPLPEPEPEPEPEEPNMIDLLDYLMGDGHTYTTYSVFPDYTGVSHNQTDLDGRRFFHTKGVIVPWDEPASWEELWYDEHFIWRGTDISPSNEEYYAIYRNPGATKYGVPWVPRKLEEDDSYYVEAWVQFFKKSDGQPVPGKNIYMFPHWIKFHKYYESHTFEGGTTLNDVVEMHGILDDGTTFERYWYAKGYGLVGWQDAKTSTGNRMYFESPTAPGRLTRKEIPSIHLIQQDQLPRLVSPPEEEPVETVKLLMFDEEWTPVFIDTDPDYSYWNVRSEPNTSSIKLTQIYKGEARHALIRDVAVKDGEYLWYNIRLVEDNKYPGFEDFDAFNLHGWVRNDGIEHPIQIYVLPDPKPDPDPVYARIYLPMAEFLSTPEIANAIARRIKLMSVGNQLLIQDGDIVGEATTEGLDWLADLFENWQTTIGQANGIIIYEVDEDGNLIPPDEE